MSLADTNVTGWLEGDRDSFVETAAYLCMDWNLCDSEVFQDHCIKAFNARKTPDQAAVSWLETQR